MEVTVADNDELLRILVQLNGRQAFPAEMLRGIVGSGKCVVAYNLCDGSRTQAEVVKEAKVDQVSSAGRRRVGCRRACYSSSVPGETRSSCISIHWPRSQRQKTRRPNDA